MLTNAAVKSFCNESLRPLCDRIAGMVGLGNLILAAWDAKGIDALLGQDDTVVIDDGAAEDGRTPITVGDVRAVMTALGGLHAQFEADSKALYGVFGKPAVNPR